VRTYYAYISAFCDWAVREGHLTENVAQRRNATEPIPDDGGHKSSDQQAAHAIGRVYLELLAEPLVEDSNVERRADSSGTEYYRYTAE
jgi:exopolyphosphatase/pppGpp-phosphohydrolase